jgi:hypothetical protein
MFSHKTNYLQSKKLKIRCLVVAYMSEHRCDQCSLKYFIIHNNNCGFEWQITCFICSGFLHAIA